MTGAASRRVVTPPKAGLDFAAVKTRGGYLVVSADPITGVEKDIGRYAVKVSANDVATSGNRPQFAESVVLLPEGAGASDVAEIARQIHEAAAESGIAIVGGHTEVTPGIEHPIVVMTVFSFVQKFVTSGGARAGDSMMMTKSAGLEGTAAIASGAGGFRLGLSSKALERAKGMARYLSIVDEAAAAYESGWVRAMHDCTEGGVLGAVFEMSLASGVGFRVRESEVPVAPETRAICRSLSLDPLKLIGSGSLLLAVKRGGERSVERALKPVCVVTRIGEFTKSGRVLVKTDGGSYEMKEAPEDELWRALGRTV